ncbi:MAG: hypothetical protein QW112_03660, partial [Candidatus Micrarchaeia archaeon]
AFNITSPSTRRAPTYPDYKYKRPSIDVSRRVIGAGKKGWGFVAGRLASQKAEKINNYINKLVTAGVLSKKDAESMKELAVDERLARLLGQDIKREINKVNLVKMSAEFKMN